MKTDRRAGGEAFNLPSLGALESSGSDSLSQLRETLCASQLLGSEETGDPRDGALLRIGGHRGWVPGGGGGGLSVGLNVNNCCRSVKPKMVL